MGDISGATNTLHHFFNTAFQDQIAQSGEQPFEAIRTRPFHYRGFNLEALIVRKPESKNIFANHAFSDKCEARRSDRSESLGL